MNTSDMPGINASLNFLSTLCLIIGFYFIKRKNKNEKLHRLFMLSALVFSALFLTGYLIYHYHHGSKPFPELGWIKTLYLSILIPHIILAIVMVPMIVMTFYYAFTNNREKHKKLAKVTWPIWMYVSITGVLIFLMLYRWFKV
jgi:putative membrane protein